MFGLNNIALWLIGALSVMLLVTGGTTWYFKSEYATALEQKGQLATALEVQKGATAAALEAVDAWKTSAENFQSTLEQLANAQIEANREARRLNDIFTTHDLGDLAKKKPGLIQNRVNAGTADMFRLLESTSRGVGAGGSGEAGSDAGSP